MKKEVLEYLSHTMARENAEAFLDKASPKTLRTMYNNLKYKIPEENKKLHEAEPTASEEKLNQIRTVHSSEKLGNGQTLELTESKKNGKFFVKIDGRPVSSWKTKEAAQKEFDAYKNGGDPSADRYNEIVGKYNSKHLENPMETKEPVNRSAASSEKTTIKAGQNYKTLNEPVREHITKHLDSYKGYNAESMERLVLKPSGYELTKTTQKANGGTSKSYSKGQDEITLSFDVNGELENIDSAAETQLSGKPKKPDGEHRTDRQLAREAGYSVKRDGESRNGYYREYRNGDDIIRYDQNGYDDRAEGKKYSAMESGPGGKRRFLILYRKLLSG